MASTALKMILCGCIVLMFGIIDINRFSAMARSTSEADKSVALLQQHLCRDECSKKVCYKSGPICFHSIRRDAKSRPHRFCNFPAFVPPCSFILIEKKNKYNFCEEEKTGLHNKLARCFSTSTTDIFALWIMMLIRMGRTSTIFRCHYLLSFRVFETFISVALLFPMPGPLFMVARSVYFHWFKHPKTFHVHTKWKGKIFTAFRFHSSARYVLRTPFFGAMTPTDVIYGARPDTLASHLQ